MDVTAAAAIGVRAFGIPLSLGFDVVGLADASGPPASDATRVELTDDASLEAAHRTDGARIVGRMDDDRGNLAMEVHEHPEDGYLVELPPLGRYGVSGDGRRIRCVAPESPDWEWQRGLIGQILPLAGLLRGHVILHASVLALDGRAFALAGPPGAGKSSLALQLSIRGAAVVAEDTVALTPFADGVLAEPGVALMALRPAEVDRVGRAALREIGEFVGESDKLVLRLSRAPGAVPLRSMYLLEPGGSLADGIQVIPAPGPAELLGDAFVPYVESAEAMLAHLDVAARMAATVGVLRVPADRDEGPDAVADAILAHQLSGGA